MMATAEGRFCHSCRGPVDFDGRLGFRESCQHCEADLHCCLNCELYDPGAHNSCREPVTEYVPDKEKRNFCGWFSFVGGERNEEDEKAAALSKLDALFKK
ncbi:MAG: hypothetical protein CMH55_08470 [Myxococcales bacterium]|nr:hypothetical protein [Myxococcales bacterium]|tara:strand:- start:239 stop:538 length:300 start_codon:yes stop_codon:yes gene_type:complete